MDKKSKILYIASLIFSILSFIGIAILLIIIFDLCVNDLELKNDDLSTNYIGAIFAILLVRGIISVGLVIISSISSSINSIIALILILLVKNKNKKCKILMWYNIIVLCLQFISLIFIN